MRTFAKTVLFAAVVFALFTSTSDAQFKHRGNWLGPVLTLATDPIGFGVNFEHGISKNVGIGGIIRYWGKSESILGSDYSWSIIMPQAQGAYHFMPGDQLDPYAGGRLGWAIYSFDAPGLSARDDGGLFLTAFGGLRYFFTPKVAGNASLEFRVAGDDYFDGALQLSVGADFTL
ncbi:MAG: hypothetical protein C0600_12100 [Ignavibacteria bacterium]|nr:MAG: hypothetical protein C0600_12100 [Ignavibacteria bacterium]